MTKKGYTSADNIFDNSMQLKHIDPYLVIPVQHFTSFLVGQALYPKGWRELLDLLITAGPELSDLVVDGFGSGSMRIVPDFSFDPADPAP